MATRRSYQSARHEDTHEDYEIALDSEVFHAAPWRMNPSQMIDVPGIAVTGDSRAMWDAFRAAMAWPFKDDEGAELDPDNPAKWDTTEYDRFRSYVQMPGRDVPAEVLAQILADLIEAGTGRPTVRSSS